MALFIFPQIHPAKLYPPHIRIRALMFSRLLSVCDGNSVVSFYHLTILFCL